MASQSGSRKVIRCLTLNEIIKGVLESDEDDELSEFTDPTATPNDSESNSPEQHDIIPDSPEKDSNEDLTDFGIDTRTNNIRCGRVVAEERGGRGAAGSRAGAVVGGRGVICGRSTSK